MNLVLEGKLLFVSFRFKDTIDKLEYISSLFQINNILIFVKRECQLSISQMLCMNSAAECESAPLQMSFVTQNWWAASSKCQLDKNRTYSSSPKWDFTGTSFKNIVFSSIYQLYIIIIILKQFFSFWWPKSAKIARKWTAHSEAPKLKDTLS